MNSRNSLNEANLVNFPADLSTLNQLDTKEPLLSFPFDHIYACHSESTERRQTGQLDKEVEISTHYTEDKDLSSRLTSLENQNKKLKDLLVYHLDLIQQQNDLITKREKVYQAVKQENDTLKAKLSRVDKKLSGRHLNLPPAPVPTSTVTHTTTTVVKTEPSTSSQLMYNSFPDLLPDNRQSSLLYDSNVANPAIKPFGADKFGLGRSADADTSSYLTNNFGGSSSASITSYNMIDNKRSYLKKDIKTEPPLEPMYTLSTNSGNPGLQKIQRNRRRASGIGSLSRMKIPPKTEPSEATNMFDEDNSYDRSFKKSKMLNTYGKSKSGFTKRDMRFTGSLSDRLQLIDTTPTGEDPYQIGEAEMREQSPIPKLMLQKSHGRVKIFDNMTDSAAKPRRIYDSLNAKTNKSKSSKTNSTTTVPDALPPPNIVIKEEPKPVIVSDPDLNSLIKTESVIDWGIFAEDDDEDNRGQRTMGDFSYGETSNNLASNHLLNTVDYGDIFQSELSTEIPLNMDGEVSEFNSKMRRRGVRTTSLAGPEFGEDVSDVKRIGETKRGRKRAFSTTGLARGAKRDTLARASLPGPKPRPIKGRVAIRAKKVQLPGLMTRKPYHTLMGGTDVSWYYGLDPDVKLEDIEVDPDRQVSTVEVPRWREKPYTSCYTLEGTENLDDKVFEKRHQKLEAEERRQLRWHMRRIREQRHVERLRLRQRDTWYGGLSTYHQPAMYTIWPQPQRDIRFIEITDTLPVLALGEPIPAIPPSDFVLPWVRTSKAQKRSKRSRTHH